jgi:hypothetical protein
MQAWDVAMLQSLSLDSGSISVQEISSPLAYVDSALDRLPLLLSEICILSMIQDFVKYVM